MKNFFQILLNRIQGGQMVGAEAKSHVVFTLRGYDPARHQRLQFELSKLRKSGHEVMVLSQRDRLGLLESLRRYKASSKEFTVVL